MLHLLLVARDTRAIGSPTYPSEFGVLGGAANCVSPSSCWVISHKSSIFNTLQDVSSIDLNIDWPYDVNVRF